MHRLLFIGDPSDPQTFRSGREARPKVAGGRGPRDGAGRCGTGRPPASGPQDIPAFTDTFSRLARRL